MRDFADGCVGPFRDQQPGASAFLPGQVSVKPYNGSPTSALAARTNVDGRLGIIALHQGDLFAPLGDKRYDLILTNPPYVDEEALNAFPPEFAAEPRLAHAGGLAARSAGRDGGSLSTPTHA